MIQYSEPQSIHGYNTAHSSYNIYSVVGIIPVLRPHIYLLQHLRNLEIRTGDMVGEEKSKKKDYRFYVQRVDGRYLFKVRVSMVCDILVIMEALC